jgi:hypothetical protein
LASKQPITFSNHSNVSLFSVHLLVQGTLVVVVVVVE